MVEHRTKVCSTCGKEKSIFDFYENASNRDGYSNVCKECQKKYSLEWSERNRERKNQLARERYQRRKERLEVIKRIGG